MTNLKLEIEIQLLVSVTTFILRLIIVLIITCLGFQKDPNVNNEPKIDVPHVHISTTKVCTQTLPIPEKVEVIHAGKNIVPNFNFFAMHLYVYTVCEK